MTDYALSAEHVKKAESIIDDHKGRFTQLAAKLESEIQDHTKTGWQGQGADAFVALQAYWQQENKAILGILDTLRDGMKGTSTQAMNAEINAMDGVKAAERALQNNPRLGRLG